MKIIMIWIQRKCNYDGEFAPELIGAIDEYSNDDNPDFIDDKYKELCQEIGKEYESVKIIETKISDIKLSKIMNSKYSIDSDELIEV